MVEVVTLINIVAVFFGLLWVGGKLAKTRAETNLLNYQQSCRYMCSVCWRSYTTGHMLSLHLQAQHPNTFEGD